MIYSFNFNFFSRDCSGNIFVSKITIRHYCLYSNFVFCDCVNFFSIRIFLKATETCCKLCCNVGKSTKIGQFLATKLWQLVTQTCHRLDIMYFTQSVGRSLLYFTLLSSVQNELIVTILFNGKPFHLVMLQPLKHYTAPMTFLILCIIIMAAYRRPFCFTAVGCLISEFACPIVTKLCHMFDGDPDL